MEPCTGGRIKFLEVMQSWEGNVGKSLKSVMVDAACLCKSGFEFPQKGEEKMLQAMISMLEM